MYTKCFRYFDHISNSNSNVLNLRTQPDNSIDNLVGAFEVPVGSLLQKDSRVNLNFKWPDNPLLIYKNNYITVNTTNNGVTHEQNG